MSVSRETFAHGLRAVLEHAGPANQHLDFVGFEGTNLLWATDRYTVGIHNNSESVAAGHLPAVFLPTKEARDLLKFTRPERVRDRMMRVEILVAPSPVYDPSTGHSEMELHVGIRPDDPNSDEVTSEVYSLYPGNYPLLHFDQLWRELQEIRRQAFYTDEFVLRPDFAARFKPAAKEWGDRMRWHPAAPVGGKAGQRAIVTVGSDFLGAIVGLGEPADNNEIPFGDSTLEKWGL